MRALSHHFGLEVVLSPQIKCFTTISFPSAVLCYLMEGSLAF